MDYQKFIAWLQDSHGMTKRSAKDVVSRLKRVKRITNTEKLDSQTIDTLTECQEYLEAGRVVKAQLKRSVSLFLEFMSSK